VLLRLFNGVLSDNLLRPVSFFAPFIAAQIFFMWFGVWSPLETMVVRKRLTACGFTRDQLATGITIGISDPARNSLKKMTLVEEDLGMLWIGDDVLSYRGDGQSFDVPRGDLLAVERKADAGAASSYFGAVHVIIRFRQPDGTERRVRLHPEQVWTQTGRARALNYLAERLESWRQSPGSLTA
jgi:hypothetical protein